MAEDPREGELNENTRRQLEAAIANMGTILVRAGRDDGRVAIWDTDAAYEGGELMIKGFAGHPDLDYVYEVPKTAAVMRKLREGALVEAEDPDEAAGPAPEIPEPVLPTSTRATAAPASDDESAITEPKRRGRKPAAKDTDPPAAALAAEELPGDAAAEPPKEDAAETEAPAAEASATEEPVAEEPAAEAPAEPAGDETSSSTEAEKPVSSEKASKKANK